jgi:HEAT repeat protein
MEASEHGDRRAILELGRLGDKSAIPFLSRIAQQPDKQFHSAAANARMALAKLGLQSEFDGIVNELRSDDPAEQHNAVQKLEYINGPQAIRTLIGLLEYTEWRVGKRVLGPNGEPPKDKLIYVPQSYAAMQALARIVPNPPVQPGTEPTDALVPVWRKWWADVGSKMYQ